MFSRRTEFAFTGKQKPPSEPTYSSYHVDILRNELDQINDLIMYPHFTEVNSMIQSVSRTIEQSFDIQIDNQSVQENVGPCNLARSIDSGRHQSQSSDLELFVQAAQATSIMVYRYAVPKLPFNDLANQSYLDLIINAMLYMPCDRWRILKYFRLFM